MESDYSFPYDARPHSRQYSRKWGRASSFGGVVVSFDFFVRRKVQQLFGPGKKWTNKKLQKPNTSIGHLILSQSLCVICGINFHGLAAFQEYRNSFTKFPAPPPTAKAVQVLIPYVVGRHKPGNCVSHHSRSDFARCAGRKRGGDYKSGSI